MTVRVSQSTTFQCSLQEPIGIMDLYVIDDFDVSITLFLEANFSHPSPARAEHKSLFPAFSSVKSA